MSNTHTTPFEKCISYSFLIAGMVTLIVASQQALYAQELTRLTAGGAYTTNFEQEVELSGSQLAIAAPVQLHAAAAQQPASASAQLIIGMILVLFGFFVHAMMVMRHERPIRVHAAPRPRQPKRLPFEYYLEEYWLEHRHDKF